MTADDPRLASLARFRQAVADGSLYEMPAGETDRAVLAIIDMAEGSISAGSSKDRTITSLKDAVDLLERQVAAQAEQIDALRDARETAHDAMARFCEQHGIPSSRAQ